MTKLRHLKSDSQEKNTNVDMMSRVNCRLVWCSFSAIPIPSVHTQIHYAQQKLQGLESDLFWFHHTATFELGIKSRMLALKGNMSTHLPPNYYLFLLMYRPYNPFCAWKMWYFSHGQIFFFLSAILWHCLSFHKKKKQAHPEYKRAIK